MDKRANDWEKHALNALLFLLSPTEFSELEEGQNVSASKKLRAGKKFQELENEKGKMICERYKLKSESESLCTEYASIVSCYTYYLYITNGIYGISQLIKTVDVRLEGIEKDKYVLRQGI